MKKLTINEIAEMVGVSKTTISFYLNGKTNKMSDETQKKIQQVIEETGYTPSAATRTVKASDDCIGVILGDVSKPFAAKALKGIEEEAHEAGYQVIVGSNEMSFAKEKEYVEHMLKMGVSGFIIQATYRFGILAMELEKKNKKVVYLDIPPYDSQGVRVLGDNYQCVYDAISQCIERGYDQLLVVSDANESEYTGMDNLRGFKDAANDAGVSFKTYFIEAETTREEIHDYLETKSELVLSSDLKKDCSKRGQEKVLEICKLLQADTYYNAIGGQALYSFSDFKENGITLKFLKAGEIKYQQFGDKFVPGLSIVDVLMFNSKEEVRKQLQNYTLVQEEE